MVSFVFQKLTESEDLFCHSINLNQFKDKNASGSGPTTLCKTKLDVLKCLAEAGGLTAALNDMVAFLFINGPKAWEALVEYAVDKVTRNNENGDPRKRA